MRLVPIFDAISPLRFVGSGTEVEDGPNILDYLCYFNYWLKQCNIEFFLR